MNLPLQRSPLFLGLDEANAPNYVPLLPSYGLLAPPGKPIDGRLQFSTGFHYSDRQIDGKGFGGRRAIQDSTWHTFRCPHSRQRAWN